jgi:hypothetical protein
MDQVSIYSIEPATEEDLKNETGLSEGRLVMVENIDVVASRLLMGTIKAKYEEGWRTTHGKIIAEAQRIQESKNTPAA